MSQPYVAEIRLFGFNFAPRGWALCNGQLLPVQQNQALFSLIGTTYGGNGVNNFQLPNLQGCAPMHRNNANPIGAFVGEENHTLALTELPAHNHLVNTVPTAGGQLSPAGNVLAAAATNATMYSAAGGAGLVPMAAQTVGMAGGNQPHSNQQPYLVLNACIALQGAFPSRN
ncbi:phage tail protein [Pseudolysobacter antarcticus]|uniref:Phage tail protein n=1 Tax=Pseudolysobacter antarcticus TaxID=2511995 RepID=A0A411HN58_9GAMM|nr:tail fiber protein [Pseudolysobacter antarcticus]QBB71919.1 phage tail protein [Pseudolysobacter antarcticus]